LQNQISACRNIQHYGLTADVRCEVSQSLLCGLSGLSLRVQKIRWFCSNADDQGGKRAFAAFCHDVGYAQKAGFEKSCGLPEMVILQIALVELGLCQVLTYARTKRVRLI